jgi:PPOX class probable F420-dependent enzyme
MAGRTVLTEHEVELVQSQRVGRLATCDADATPYVVPVCFAFDGKRFYTPLDEKPKRVADASLQRVRNILATGRAALLVDRYDDDWSRLAYVLVHGEAELLSPQAEGHHESLELLRARYPQYREMALEERPIIAITPERVVSWGHLTL